MLSVHKQAALRALAHRSSHMNNATNGSGSDMFDLITQLIVTNYPDLIHNMDNVRRMCAIKNKDPILAMISN